METAAIPDQRTFLDSCLVEPLQDEIFIFRGRQFIKTTWNGLSVIKDKTTGYYQASKACKDNGKRINDWLRNKDTQEYLNSASHECGMEIECDFTDAGIPASGLLYKINIDGKDLADGFGEIQGYYIHPDLFHDVCYWANKPYAVKVSRLMNLINERNRLLNQTLEQTIHRYEEEISKLKQEQEITKEELRKKEELIKDLTYPFDETKNKPMIYALPVGESHFQLRVDNNPNGNKGLRCFHLFNPSDVVAKVKQELSLDGLIQSSNGKRLISNDQLNHVFSLIEKIKENTNVQLPSPDERDDFIDKRLKKYRSMKMNAMIEGLIYEMEEIKKHQNFIPWKLIPRGLMDQQGEQKRDNGIDAVEFDENSNVKTIIQIKHHRGNYLRRDELQSFLNKCQQDRYKSVQKKLFIHRCKLSQSLRKELEEIGIEIIINETSD